MNEFSSLMIPFASGSADDAKFTVSPLMPADIAAISNLTFPAYRSSLPYCLTGEAQNGFAVVALVARADDIPVGLVMAELPSDIEANEGKTQSHKTARLISVSVTPAWRRCGVASRLIRSMEAELRKRACVWLTTSYTTRMPSWQSFERLLLTCQWFAPEPRMLMSLGRVPDILEAPSLNQSRETPPDFELFEWSQLGSDEIAKLQLDVENGEIPLALSPFADTEEIEPAISVGVRHGGEVVAWMIVTRSPLIPNALCYRTQFVRPHFRAARGLGPLVLAEAIHRHNASPVKAERPVGAFGMSFGMSTKMINFFRKRLSPYCFSTYESRASAKRLV